MTSEIFYTRIFSYCLRSLSDKRNIINTLFFATKFKAEIIALLVCLFFSFLVNLLTFCSENTICLMEISDCPKE